MTTALDFKSAEQEVLRRLDIRRELAGKVSFTSDSPNESGWLPCYAIGRDDSSPSACVNTSGKNGAIGKYKDSGSGDESCSFWELTVKVGLFPDWKTSRAHYSKQTGIELPVAASKKDGADGLLDRVGDLICESLYDTMAAMFCASCPPVAIEAVKKSGAIFYRWNGMRCIGFKAYRGIELVAIILRRVDGQKFPAAGSLHERKTHLIRGSKDGWVVLGDMKTAKVVWMVEGVPDALSLYPHLPTWHAVISNVAGSAGGHGLPFDIFASKTVNVIGDCDDAGQSGAKKRALAAAAFSDDVRIVLLPFTHTSNHGKDTRDFFLEGGSIEHLMSLATQGELVARTAVPHTNFASIPWIPSEGDRVKAKDRGNFGEVVAVCGTTCTVKFINPHDGNTAEIEYAADQLEAAGGGSNRPKRPILRHTLKAMREAYPKLDPPVIDGLLREFEVMNLIASPKVGKSWLTYFIALSVVAGRLIFEKFATARGRVLLIDNELRPSLVPRRIKDVANAMGLRPEEYDEQIDIWSLRGSPRSIFDLEAEFTESPLGTYKLVILDAKYKSLADDADENSNSDEARYYAQAGLMAELTGAAWIFVHHSSKGSQSDKRLTDVGSGGSSQARAADSHCVIREHEEHGAFVLAAAVRSFPPVEPIGLRWSYPLWVRDENIDPAQLKGSKSPWEEKQGKSNMETDSKILECCQTWKTRREIRRMTGFGDDRRDRSIARLVEMNYLESDFQNRPRNPKCEVFRKTIYAK